MKSTMDKIEKHIEEINKKLDLLLSLFDAKISE